MTLFRLLVLVCFSQIASLAQAPPNDAGVTRGFVAGVASVSQVGPSSSEFYIGKLIRTEQLPPGGTCGLEIETANGAEPRKWKLPVEKESCDWNSVSGLPGGILTGFALWAEFPRAWAGRARIFVLEDGKFQPVLDSGYPAEIVDIDGDGYVEVIASEWPDSDENPKTSHIYVWDGERFRLAFSIPWTQRLGERSLSKTRRFGKMFAKNRDKHLPSRLKNIEKDNDHSPGPSTSTSAAIPLWRRTATAPGPTISSREANVSFS